MENPWHQTDTNAHFFSVSLGHLTSKKYLCVYVSQTESLGKDYVTLSHEIPFLRKDAFQTVGYQDAAGKVKDLKTIIFLKAGDSGCESENTFHEGPGLYFPLFTDKCWYNNQSLVFWRRRAWRMRNSAGERFCHQGFCKLSLVIATSILLYFTSKS